MFDFLKSLFNPAPPSSTTAKERLRLVLLSDHLSLSPETVQALKADLLAVISKYVEIDPRHADVTFEHRENEVAMLANIPITGVRERKRAIEENVASQIAPSAAAASPAMAVVPPALDPAVASDARSNASATDDVEDEVARNNAAALTIHEDVQPTLDLRATVPPAPSVSPNDIGEIRSEDDVRGASASATAAADATGATPAASATAAATATQATGAQATGTQATDTQPTTVPSAQGNHTTRRRRRKKNQNNASRPPAPQSFGKPAQA